MMRTVIFLVSLLLPVSVLGQADSTIVDTVQSVDTVLYDGKGLLEHANPVTSGIDFEKRLSQNPTLGLFKSMLIPGWGQLGNGRYIKAMIFAGLDAWFIGAAVHYGKQASDFREKYDAATDLELRRDYYDLYLDRKDERNKYTWFAVIVTFISMFDAYVDAHLSGYPDKPKESDLGFDVRPVGDGFMATVSMDF